jgi:hypothetical protein
MEIDDNLRSKIQLEKAKARAREKQINDTLNSSGAANHDRQCGNINIGNEEPREFKARD